MTHSNLRQLISDAPKEDPIFIIEDINEDSKCMNYLKYVRENSNRIFDPNHKILIELPFK